MHLTFVYGRDRRLKPELGPENSGGGIVTALLSLTRHLAARGHEVDVFSRCHTPGTYEGVRFHDRSALAAFSSLIEPDALVVVPEGLPLLMPIRARARVLWTGNAFNEGDVALTAPWTWAPELGRSGENARLYPMGLFAPCIDRVVAKSLWQRDHLAERMGLPTDAFHIAYNGVDLDLFGAPAWPRPRHRIVYTSQPRRGLDVLLRLFPKIKARVPQAELHVFSSDLLDAAGWSPGVFYRGRVTKDALAEELAQAAVMAYPSTLSETFCTSVAEAQAAGVPVVCASKAALAERITNGVDGVLVDGDATSDAFGDRFVDEIVRLMQNDARRARMGMAAAETARRQYGWPGIAKQWEDELAALTAGRPAATPPVPAVDLTDDALLEVRDRGRRATVPADLAEDWLQRAWASYGFEAAVRVHA